MSYEIQEESRKHAREEEQKQTRPQYRKRKKTDPNLEDFFEHPECVNQKSNFSDKGTQDKRPPMFTQEEIERMMRSFQEKKMKKDWREIAKTGATVLFFSMIGMAAEYLVLGFLAFVSALKNSETINASLETIDIVFTILKEKPLIRKEYKNDNRPPPQCPYSDEESSDEDDYPRQPFNFDSSDEDDTYSSTSEDPTFHKDSQSYPSSSPTTWKDQFNSLKNEIKPTTEDDIHYPDSEEDHPISTEKTKQAATSSAIQQFGQFKILNCIIVNSLTQQFKPASRLIK